MPDSVYLPRIARITDIRDEARGIKTFALEVEGQDGGLAFTPGQFLEVSLFGVGEAPFSISSAGPDGRLELTIASVGEVTEEFHSLGIGGRVGVRGPYGRGFPLDAMKGRDLLFLAGGIGLAPLRSVIAEVMARRADFGAVTILYGARNPGLLCFAEDLQSWASAPNTTVRVTVDHAENGWDGPVGTVTSLLTGTELQPREAIALVCGPPVMIRHSIEDLLGLGFGADSIITTLERRMECGVGKCGHCNVGRARVCVDGPVFTYSELLELDERY